MRQGVTIAPLPPRLVPQSKLGLGLAVFLLLSRFDDHVAYYTLERNFRERFGVVIPRQQMVQWVEKMAHFCYWPSIGSSGKSLKPATTCRSTRRRSRCSTRKSKARRLQVIFGFIPPRADTCYWSFVPAGAGKGRENDWRFSRDHADRWL